MTALAVTGRAQGLQNGSFENTTGFSPNEAAATMDLTPGSTVITGWTVVNNNVDWIGAGNPYGLSAYDGSYFVDVTGAADRDPDGGLVQTVSTIVAQQYNLSFVMGSSTTYDAPGALPSITASATGNSPSTFTLTETQLTSGGANAWWNFSYNFTAIEFAGLTVTPAGTYNYVGLDDVTLTTVPEPSSLGLLSLGLAGLARFGIRNKKAQ
jgi:hypothetical protein